MAPLTRGIADDGDADEGKPRDMSKKTASGMANEMEGTSEGRAGDRTLAGQGDHGTGIGIRRYFTTPGVDPYDGVAWERRDSRITNFRDGAVAFEQLGVEVPATWSLNATNILAQKYFRGIPGSSERETSLRQVADRVVDTITEWGRRDGYFTDDDEAESFRAELKHTVVTQKAAFNSPVWFNIGAKGRTQQAAACFILAVDDTMSSILNWYVEEGTIFKGGSGSGINLSRIRSSKEHLNGGGTASGPVSFMRGADASAGTIKSGGATRRAAKMVILDADHPDIEDFIWCKAVEERKARALAAAGFDMDLDGRDSHSIQYQNANNSVRVTDEFMQAVLDDGEWDLKAVTTGAVLQTIKARDLFRQIAEAAWECADPGMQFDTTINRWHTAANTGRINASNPCSEYLHLDNSACNLASVNLLRFLDETGHFDVDGFRHTVEVVFTAQEILVGNADYPTEAIADTSRRFRQLGLGYANLGAMLMALGLPYDSDAGRAWAAAVTSLMTGHAYATSARTAARMGPFAGYADNAEHMLRVLGMHRDAAADIDQELVPTDLLGAARAAWDDAVELGHAYGVRNSQATVLAPTGCLVGSSLVPTGQGLVRLASLGDPDGEQWQDLDLEVMTDEGPRSATKFYVNGLERVVEVTTARGYRLAGTTKHQVKVVDAAGDWVWRALADLVPGDRLPLALDQLVGDPRPVRLPAIPVPGPSDRDDGPGDAAGAGHRFPTHLSATLAELVGYAVGAGSVDPQGLTLRVDGADIDVVEHLRLLAKELFAIEATVEAGASHFEVALASSRLAVWWEACGFGSDRALPGAVLASNDGDVYAAFVRGLFEAEATVAGSLPCWSTAAGQLAGEVQSLLLALGLPTSRKADEGRSVLRLLNGAHGGRWNDAVGFIGGRKVAAARLPRRPPAQRDDVPLPARLAPGGVGRALPRSAVAELHERTGDTELAHLLGFFYDEVATTGLGEEELTYDLSVPENVTYVAGGFVSHNTIGLLMDCDTTGVEPDLGLCKMKKLVGGGTMTIVNQTVPRALRRLGYQPDEVAAVVTYVDEHKTILGAPHLAPGHVAVFACSMGDNPIHYMGHVKMLGAVQPFISGAVSKTVNTPVDTTVEQLEQLHIDAWRLGVKAVAIYRDNCKVGQPLSTAKVTPTLLEGKVEVAPEALLEAVAAAELAPAQVVERIVERVVNQPTREKLPRSRHSRTFEFRVADCKGFVTVGEYDDGRPGEVFMKVSKQGSTLAGILDSFAIAVSYGLQYGVPLTAFVSKFTNVRFEPAGMTDDPDIRFASSLVDYIFRRLAVDYLPLEERMELGILSVGERLNPTLPGIEEAAVETTAGLDTSTSPPSVNTASADLDDLGPLTPPTPAPSPSAPTARAAPAQALVRSANLDAPYCMQCGVQMQRAGSCHACPSCGTTSGCS